jgi:hypothetical protein
VAKQTALSLVGLVVSIVCGVRLLADGGTVRSVRLQTDRSAVRSVRFQADRSAATTPDDGKREFTISGCLLRSGYAGYQIDDAHVDAIDGKPVADDQASKSSTGASVPKKWVLEGGGNLGADTGKKVQVVGRSEWSPSPAADEPPNRTPHLDVKSVKVVAAACS